MGVKTIHDDSKANRVPHFWTWQNDDERLGALNDLLAFFACIFGAFTGVDGDEPKRHWRVRDAPTLRHRARKIAANMGQTCG